MPQTAALAPPINFYTGQSDEEAPLTGGALRDVLLAGAHAADVVIGSRGHQRTGEALTLRQRNPTIHALLRAPLSEPVPASAVATADEADPFSGLSAEDMGLLGPVFQAALVLERGSHAATVSLPPPPYETANGLSDDVMRYLHTRQTASAQEGDDTSEARPGDLLARAGDASEGTAGIHTRSSWDSRVSDAATSIPLTETRTAGTTSRIQRANPLLSRMLDVPVVAPPAYALAVQQPSSSRTPMPPPQPSQPVWEAWHAPALAYATTVQAISAPPSSLGRRGAAQAVDHTVALPPLVESERDRVSRTVRVLRLLAAVARRDFELPRDRSHPFPRNVTRNVPRNIPRVASVAGEAVTQYDARYLLCAAYRAISMDLPAAHGWLEISRFTNALSLDTCTYTRWAVQYRQDPAASNAFWQTLAPDTWIDAFSLIDSLEAARGGPAPTLDDLARTPLHGRLSLGRVKRPRMLAREDVYASPVAVSAVDNDAEVDGDGATPVGVNAGVDRSATRTMIAADTVESTGTPVTVQISPALLRIAKWVRLVAAAASGKVVPTRTLAQSGDPLRRLDPRHLLIAIHYALVDNVRAVGQTLTLRSFALTLGLVPRTVYAWNYAYRANRTESSSDSAALGRELVAESGTDQNVFLAALKAAMQAPRPGPMDYRNTPLHDRLHRIFEVALGNDSKNKLGTLRSLPPRRRAPSAAAASSGAASPAALSEAGTSSAADRADTAFTVSQSHT